LAAHQPDLTIPTSIHVFNFCGQMDVSVDRDLVSMI